jgi:hypothetical protein
LNGAQIVAAMTFACLQTLDENTTEIQTKHLLKGIELEYNKEEKMFTTPLSISKLTNESV